MVLLLSEVHSSLLHEESGRSGLSQSSCYRCSAVLTVAMCEMYFYCVKVVVFDMSLCVDVWLQCVVGVCKKINLNTNILI